LPRGVDGPKRHFAEKGGGKELDRVASVVGGCKRCQNVPSHGGLGEGKAAADFVVGLEAVRGGLTRGWKCVKKLLTNT